MSHYPKYSIVIPAFNESARIPATLESVIACVRANAWDAEIIVVNDGSTDNTAEIVLDMARTAGVRLLENWKSPTAGKGYAVRNGILHALGDVVMFTDSDLSAPIVEAERLFAAIAGGADIAIGSRWLESGRQTHRQPLYRQFFGRCFNTVCRMVMNLPFADTQCGFKAFTRSAAQTVFQLQTIERWGFDPEILFIALKRGFKIQEVPVSWAQRDAHRVEQPSARRHADAERARHGALECDDRPLQPQNRHQELRTGETRQPRLRLLNHLAFAWLYAAAISSKILRRHVHVDGHRLSVKPDRRPSS